MANLGFVLRATFGLLPKAQKIESVRTALQQEFDKLIEFKGSNELKEYYVLKELVESEAFQRNKKEILALDFKKTEEFQKEQQYKILSKKKELVNYFAVLESVEYQSYLNFEKAEELMEFQNLQGYLASQEFKNEVAECEVNLKNEKSKLDSYKKLKKSSNIKQYFKSLKKASADNLPEKTDEILAFEKLEEYVTSPIYNETLASLKFQNSDAYKKQDHFNKLKNSQTIKDYFRFKNSKKFKLFQQVIDSDLLTQYNTLKELVESDKFQESKSYMLDKEKWQKTDDYVKESKYDELKKSADIKWYLSVADSDKFSKLNEWKLTFEDDFTTSKVDDKKWMNSFFWGKMLLNDRYVMAGDQHYYTDDKNIELNNSILKIVTKTEAARGKVWHPLHGFSEKDFKYTSGMISTAHSFRQQYGKFEAKIRLDASFPAYLAFWLKGEKILPEIDVFKFNMDKKNRFQMSTHFGDPSNVKSAQKVTSKIGGSNLTNDFYIYSFEWSPEKITWRINDYEVFSSTNGIPNEPLYLIISAGVQKDIPLENSASQFEIDWVRCYEKV